MSPESEIVGFHLRVDELMALLGRHPDDLQVAFAVYGESVPGGAPYSEPIFHHAAQGGAHDEFLTFWLMPPTDYANSHAEAVFDVG